MQTRADQTAARFTTRVKTWSTTKFSKATATKSKKTRTAGLSLTPDSTCASTKAETRSSLRPGTCSSTLESTQARSRLSARSAARHSLKIQTSRNTSELSASQNLKKLVSMIYGFFTFILSLFIVHSYNICPIILINQTNDCVHHYWSIT